MDMKELASLEEKTKQIVDTLSSLEKEVGSYQKKNLKINEAFDGLADLSNGLKNATSDFLLIIELLRKSDVGKAIEKVDNKIKKVEALCQKMDDSEKRLMEKQDELADKTNKAIANVQDMLTNMDERVNRIDRNTQKGLGREKG